MPKIKPKITLPKYNSSAVTTYLHGRCPECENGMHIESIEDESTYVDDEEMIFADGRPAFYPYKDYSCGFCGCEFRVYVGPLAVRITKETDIDIEQHHYSQLATERNNRNE